MNKLKKSILIGMILGDAYLQQTGEKNARIRLEHSEKYRDYLLWKGDQFPEYFQGKPKRYVRFNPVFKRTYAYLRWQSNASPEIGLLQRLFYADHKKIIPAELSELLVDPISLAVWYQDDGYYYKRDKMAYIYLPKYTLNEIKIMMHTLQVNFGINPRVKVKKSGNIVLVFPVMETKRLFSLIKLYIIPRMRYKIS